MGRAKKATQAAKPAKAAGKKPPGRPRKVKEPVQEEEPAEDAPADDQADDEKDSGRSEPADDAPPPPKRPRPTPPPPPVARAPAPAPAPAVDPGAWTCFCTSVNKAEAMEFWVCGLRRP